MERYFISVKNDGVFLVKESHRIEWNLWVRENPEECDEYPTFACFLPEGLARLSFAKPQARGIDMDAFERDPS